MKHTTKIVLSLVALLAFSGIEKANAQFFLFWNGDYRLGFTAGVGHNFTAFDVSAPNGYSLSGDVSQSIVTPSVGLYWGMEKELSRSTCFGFDGSIVYNYHSSSFMLKDMMGNRYDYSFCSHGITGKEGLYFAFDINRETQFNIGAGFYERIMLGCKATETPSSSSAPQCTEGLWAKPGFSVGALVSTGLTYYINDIVFVKGNVEALIPIFSSSSMTKDWSSNISSGSGELDVTPNTGFELAISGCIGFRW